MRDTSVGIDEAEVVFRPNIGQFFLALVMAFGIGLFGYFSIASFSAQQEVREDLYAQETDASALSFTQRDAFNLTFSIAEWAYGQRSARDVQIARALLEQRLRVVTSSGEVTYDVAPLAFQEALQDLDDFILGISDVPVADRLAEMAQIDPKLEEFLTQNRLLSQVFQERSRAVIQEAVQGRNRAEVQLIVTFGAIALILLILVTWLALDINRGYRTAKQKIADQRADLINTMNHLKRNQDFDSLASQVLQQISDEIATDQILGGLGTAFSEILPGVSIDVELEGSQRGATKIVAHAGTPVDVEELNAYVIRIQEVVTAILAREVQEIKLEFERRHDALTGLPNRTVLTEETQRALDHCMQSGGVAAIYLIDVDRFRDFNNSLGNSGGDAILIAVARQLQDALIASETAARLSGDEYAVVARFSSPLEAITRARQLFDSLHFTTLAGASEADVTVSMGVAIAEAYESNATDLQRSAAMAIYLAQEEERSGFVVFSEAEHASLSDRLSDELAIRNALRNGEFKLHYQPIMRLASDRPSGAEALLRWDRPGIGLLSPDSFLDTARRAGILNQLGEEVVERALSFWSRGMVQAFNIVHDGLPYISINVHPVQLEDPKFSQFVISASRRHSVPLPAIVLEVTEHVLSKSPTAINELESLRRLGVRIALDDFGTGYSALGQAQDLPLDILKVDRSFIPKEDLGGRARRLVADIHGIAATLDLVTTVEGVESVAVARTLRDLGIQYAQGFLYSKPLPEAEFLKWVQQWDTTADSHSPRAYSGQQGSSF
jgi:diguanylate cyclase (GGDEF)-like protein